MFTNKHLLNKTWYTIDHKFMCIKLHKLFIIYNNIWIKFQYNLISITTISMMWRFAQTSFDCQFRSVKIP